MRRSSHSVIVDEEKRIRAVIRRESGYNGLKYDNTLCNVSKNLDYEGPMDQVRGDQ